MKLIIFISVLLIFGCQNQNKTPAQPNQDSMQLQKNLSLDTILTLENDSILIAEFIAFKNAQLIEENGDLKWQKIYDGNIKYSSDSTFKVLNIFGEYSGGATYNPYAENHIIKNHQMVYSKIEGNITKFDLIENTDAYIVISDELSRMGSHEQKYKTHLIQDSLIIITKL